MNFIFSRLRLRLRCFVQGFIAIAVSMVCFFQPISALQVTGLYSYRVPVANESNGERRRAFSEALSAVIVKVTGEQRWLLDPRVESAVARAESYVEAVSYSSERLVVSPEQESDDDSDGLEEVDEAAEKQSDGSVNSDQEIDSEGVTSQPVEIEQRFIEVDFSAELINELLVNSNIPLWDSNRPSVLVWMILQNEEGDRTFLSDESNPEITGLIRDFALQRGLPVIFPVLDFEDRRNLPEQVIWSLDRDEIRSASQRYGPDSILSGRLHFTAGGELVGLWQFDFQGESVSFDGFDNELTSYLNAPLDRVTTRLANYFAIIPQQSTERTLGLRIEGVKNLSDYTQLMSYVTGLGLVEKVTTTTLDKQQLNLDVQVLGNATQLFELIALDRDLLPIENSADMSENLLHYRWTR